MAISIQQWEEACYGHVQNEKFIIRDILKERNQQYIRYLDIGANIGSLYDHLQGEESIIVDHAYLVEPVPFLFQYMQGKYRRDERVTLHNFSLSDKNGFLDFYTPDFLNIPSPHDYGLSKAREGGEHRFPTFRLDDVYQFHGWTSIDVVKIDTENMDYPILSSMHEFIRAQPTRPILLFEDNFSEIMEEKKAGEILRFYIDMGYDFSHSVSGIKVLV
jgi:FkbM family methyltransferase